MAGDEGGKLVSAGGPEREAFVGLVDGLDIAPITVSHEREEIDGLVIERVLWNGRIKPVYSPALGQAVAMLIASGHTYNEIAALHPAMPQPGLITGWRVRHPEFRALLESARPALAENLYHELIDVGRASGPKTAMADKVKSDNLKWVMSKLGQKVWGDRLAVDVTVKGDMAGKLEAARKRAQAAREPLEGTAQPASGTVDTFAAQGDDAETVIEDSVASMSDNILETGDFHGDEEAIIREAIEARERGG